MGKRTVCVPQRRMRLCLTVFFRPVPDFILRHPVYRRMQSCGRENHRSKSFAHQILAHDLPDKLEHVIMHDMPDAVVEYFHIRISNMRRDHFHVLFRQNGRRLKHCIQYRLRDRNNRFRFRKEILWVVSFRRGITKRRHGLEPFDGRDAYQYSALSPGYIFYLFGKFCPAVRHVFPPSS